MSLSLISEMNIRYVHQGAHTIKVRDLFSIKQENINTKDDKFFSKYWQVYAWCSIIGFVYNKRELDAELPNQSSFEYERISNGSALIANGLMLMAIGRMQTENFEDILDVKKIMTIIS